ncbi:MAG: ornithine carbamoyltransferase [Actinomycetota bacterium]|nr:ornithine carbamoyltransferase [Actinomycetota bacterium]
MRHLLEIDDLDAAELADVLERAARRDPPQVLASQGVALLFEKPSARTRNSSEMAVVQLGGHPVYITGQEVGLDTRESTEDVTRTLACYHRVLGARVFDHRRLERMVAVSALPIVNLLSDAAHPMQALADLLTIREHVGSLAGRTLAWVGDANNVARSLMLGAAMSGMKLRLASPPGYRFDDVDLDRIRAAGAEPVVCERPEEAVEGADVVSTDVWTSMGQEAEAEARLAAFEGYTVDARLMERAAPDGIFLHCLPAHRGEEVADDVVDGPRSRVWPQAENRMHAARGLLWWLVEQ